MHLPFLASVSGMPPDPAPVKNLETPTPLLVPEHPGGFALAHPPCLGQFPTDGGGCPGGGCG